MRACMPTSCIYLHRHLHRHTHTHRCSGMVSVKLRLHASRYRRKCLSRPVSCLRFMVWTKICDVMACICKHVHTSLCICEDTQTECICICWDPTRPTNSDHKQKHKKEHQQNRKKRVGSDHNLQFGSRINETLVASHLLRAEPRTPTPKP